MKISFNQNERGGVLITAVILCATMGVVIASFLTLTATRNATTLRSQAWNSAVPVLEAGIEEALTHLRVDATPEANGWEKASVNGKTIYRKHRDLGPNVGYAIVAISNISSSPVIYSRGFVPAPLGRGTITRLVQVTTAVNGPFPLGLLAQRKIQFNGGTYVVRSFNSEDPNYSTNGHFILSKSTANAKVVSISGETNAINIGNSLIFGSVGISAGGTVATGPNGSVGDANWVTNSANRGMIQEGHLTDDVNVYLPDNSLPPDRRWLPPRINVSAYGTNYAAILDHGDFVVDQMSMSGKSIMYVTGDCSLHVKGDFSVSGQASVYLSPNSSLKLYIGGNGSIGGGGIANNTGYAKNLSIYGLPTCKSISYSGGSDFIGTINAPQADVKFTGGAIIVGAVIGDTISLAGSGYFVYDEALTSGTSTFTITSYREL